MDMLYKYWLIKHKHSFNKFQFNNLSKYKMDSTTKSNCFHLQSHSKAVAGQSCKILEFNAFEYAWGWQEWGWERAEEGKAGTRDAFSGIWESLIKSISLVLNNFVLAKRIKMLNKLMNCGECANTKDAQGVIWCGCSVYASVYVCVCVCPCRKTEEKCAVKRRAKPIDPVDSLCSLQR